LIDPTTSTTADWMATATVTPSGVTGKLISRKTKQNVLDKTYAGTWRRATHEFADDVTKAVTGVPGFATSRVAFISSQTGRKELYVMDIDGANARQITNDKSISNGPAWSKDGSRLSYTSYRSGYPDTYVVDLNTNKRDRVAFFPGINSGASWSPDGSTLALTLSKDGNPELYTMPATGGEPTRLTHTRGVETSPSWSPDGTQIVYNSDDRGSVQLYTISASGGAPTRLVTNTGYASEPDWSPSGNAIAFSVRIGGQFQVGIYNLQSRQTATLSRAPGEDPSWTRNSRHLVYSQSGRLYVLDTISQNSVPIQNGLTNCTEPAVSR
jgi:TolB protein